MGVRVLFFLVLLGGVTSWSVEEELSLDKITEQVAPPTIPKTTAPKFTLLGRLDLTAEVNPLQKHPADQKSEFKNLHGLRLFLKLKASPKTSFFGEFANQDFYYVDYAGIENHVISFGKILVPFGDTRFFHHFYGGIQGKGAQGLLLQNVWAEPGINVQSQWSPDFLLDTYVINGVKASSDTAFPDLRQTADSERQAVGARLQWFGFDHVTLIFSGYFDYYWENRKLTLLGQDIYTDYGLWDLPLRLGAGIANAAAEKIPNEGTLHRCGDYVFVAGMGLGPGEWRVRYGTYNDVVQAKSDKDTHSLDVTYSWTVDVIRLMVERQWNFEAQNEVDDDLFRVMASLDF